MGLSSILDISSFFIGMIINLIFVALMCYYFKRKYDYLEMAQTEQAKILYQMIHKSTPSPPPVDYSHDPLVQPYSDSESDSDDESEENPQGADMCDITGEVTSNVTSNVTESKIIDLTDPNHVDVVYATLDLPDPMDEARERDEPMEEVRDETRDETKDELEITVNLSEESDYSKMSMKRLKEILSSKGIRAKNNIKKTQQSFSK